MVKCVGVDWAYRQAQWCALSPGGELAGEDRIAADRERPALLVVELGDEVKTCLEMMSGTLWVRDELAACGWQVEIADARKVTTVAPLAAKRDKVDRVCSPSSRAVSWCRRCGCPRPPSRLNMIATLVRVVEPATAA